MPVYAPLDIIARIDNSLLAKYANDNKILAEIDISKLKQTDVYPIYQAIQALPDEKRDKVHRDLRHIAEMADSVKIASLFGELQAAGKDIPEFHKKRVNHDKAMWALMEHPELFQNALFCTSFHNAPGNINKFRYVTENKPDLSDKSLKNLEDAIKQYFRGYDGRAEHCIVEAHKFDGKEYLIAYPSEYPDAKRGYTKDGSLAPFERHDAFVVVFIFTESGDAVDVYVTAALDVKRALFTIWAKEIMGLDNVDPKFKPSFELNKFKLPEQDFQIPIDSPVKSYAVYGLNFFPVHDPSASYNVTANIDINKKALYEELDRKKLKPLQIRRVWIEVTMQGGYKEKTKRFNISTSCCSLKLEGDGETLRQFLKSVGIDITI